MDPKISFENGCFETYYGIVKMPHYAGVQKEMHRVTADWNVSGILDSGLVFEINVGSGFVFDGCSIPRILWRICGEPFEAPRIAAALAHDWLYSAHVCSREVADEIFREICKMVGVGKVRCTVEYLALKLFGDAAWNGHGRRDNEFAREHGALWLGGEKQEGEIV